MRKIILILVMCVGIAVAMNSQAQVKSMCVSMDLAPAIQGIMPLNPVVPIEFRWVFGETRFGVAMDLGAGQYTNMLVGKTSGSNYLLDSQNYRIGIGPIIKLSGVGIEGFFLKAMAFAWYYGNTVTIAGINTTPGSDVNLGPGAELTLGYSVTFDKLVIIAEYGAQYGPSYAGAGTLLPTVSESMSGTTIKTTFGFKVGIAI